MTRSSIESKRKKELVNMKGFKVLETLHIMFIKERYDNNEEDRSEFTDAYFNSKAYTITNEMDIEKETKLSIADILTNIDTWISGSSGWRVHSILNNFINLTKYKPLNGSSYIELPLELKNPKKGLINIKNKDNECFRWCHIRKINPQDKYPERVKKVDREMVKKLDYSDISFPVSQKDYNKVERKNGIRVNIFGYENKQPYPIYVSKERFKEELNLLLIEEDRNKHYVLIKDFNSFMFKHSKHKGRKNFCMNCLQCFSTSELLNEHRKNCIVINGKQAINMPKVGENELKFNHHNKQIPVPFVIYADFQAITKKMHGCDIR